MFEQKVTLSSIIKSR